MTKRTGRFGDLPPRSGDPRPAMPFGELKGAPLPLLTQPMVAVDVREVADPKQTQLDGPMSTMKLDPAALLQGKPTIMMGPQAKPSGAPPQIDLTQHHLPEGAVDPRLALVIDPDSERSAAFRVLRHHLLEIGLPQVVIVTSPQIGDGKTRWWWRWSR